MLGQNEKIETFYWSKQVENKGSAARDHLGKYYIILCSISIYLTIIYLANESTFLAWFRTSITLVVIGVAIDRIQIPQATDSNRKRIDSLIVACGFITGGILVLLFGIYRFISIQNSLALEKFILSRIPIVSTLIASALILFLITLLCFNDTYMFN